MAVFDQHTPVKPAFSGTQYDDRGRAYTAGEGLEAAARRILDSGLPIACDIETIGTDELSYYVKVVTIGTEREVVALDPRDPKQANLCRWTLHEAPAIIFHGAAFDVPPMVFHHLLNLEDVAKVADTLVYARMADPDRLAVKSLTACAKRYLGLELDTDASIKGAFKAAGHKTIAAGFRFVDIDAPVYLRGAMVDTLTTAELAPRIWQACMEQLTEGHPFTDKGVGHAAAVELIEREQIVNRVMLRRSAIGLGVDTDVLDEYRIKHARTLDEAEAGLTAEGITPGNGGHLMARLDGLGQVPSDWPRTTKTQQLSATATHLEKLAHLPLVKQFADHKELTHVTKYLDKTAAFAAITGKVHPQVKVLGASRTGRMAYGSPELQQFPQDARAIITAEPGRNLTSIDWSSVEPVVLANMAGESALYEAYEGGGDLYAPVVEAANVDRPTAKVVLLAQMYGQGLDLLASTIGQNRAGAEALRDKVMGAMPLVKRFLFHVKTIGDQYGKVVTVSGRVLTIPRNFDGSGYAGYKGQNYIVQGSAYDVLAESIVAVHKAGLSDAVYLAMHDELVVDTDAAHDIRKLMESPPARLNEWAGRTVVLRTDMAHMGHAWAKV